MVSCYYIWHLIKKCALQGAKLSCVIIQLGDSLVAQMVKNLPAIGETRVQSLGWEDPLEKGMATCSSISAWRIP